MTPQWGARQRSRAGPSGQGGGLQRGGPVARPVACGPGFGDRAGGSARSGRKRPMPMKKPMHVVANAMTLVIAQQFGAAAAIRWYTSGSAFLTLRTRRRGSNPTKRLTSGVKTSRGYQTIANSIGEVGIIEPPVVFPVRR